MFERFRSSEDSSVDLLSGDMISAQQGRAGPEPHSKQGHAHKFKGSYAVLNIFTLRCCCYSNEKTPFREVAVTMLLFADDI